MNILQSIHQLPRFEKLKIMEFIWDDLTQEETAFESPEWHSSILAATEDRMSKGEEKFIDWGEAKKQLRKKSE